MSAWWIPRRPSRAPIEYQSGPQSAAQPPRIAQHAAMSEAPLMIGANTRWLALFLVLVWGTAAADEKLWSLLRTGGQVVLIRHVVTTPGAGDPPGFRLEDCGTQRNLTDEGREHARRIGDEWRKRAIPVERVLSSRWCRCVET